MHDHAHRSTTDEDRSVLFVLVGDFVPISAYSSNNRATKGRRKLTHKDMIRQSIQQDMADTESGLFEGRMIRPQRTADDRRYQSSLKAINNRRIAAVS
jgi:hypothetical protein